MIRFILCVLAAVLMLVFSIPLLVLAWIIGKINPRTRDRYALVLIRGALNVIIFLAGVKMEVSGEENVPKDRPVLYIGNHRSIFDIILTYPRVPFPTGYIAKIQLKKIPLLHAWMKLSRCLFLDRKDLRQGAATIFEAIDLVKTGTASIFIYPEGTRNKNENESDLLEFHEGSFKIAQRTGCPIIPVAMLGTADIFENHLPFIRKTHVRLEYGKPIDPTTFSRQEQKHLGEYTRNVMCKMLESRITEEQP